MAGLTGVFCARGVGVGFTPGVDLGVGPVTGVGEGWTLAFCGVDFGVGVGLTAVFALTGTGQR